MHIPEDLYQQIKIMSINNKRTFTDEVIHHLKAVAKSPKIESEPERARSAKEQDVIALVQKFTKYIPKDVDTIQDHCAKEGFEKDFVIQVLQDYSKEDKNREFRVAKGFSDETRYRTIHIAR